MDRLVGIRENDELIRNSIQPQITQITQICAVRRTVRAIRARVGIGTLKSV